MLISYAFDTHEVKMACYKILLPKTLKSIDLILWITRVFNVLIFNWTCQLLNIVVKIMTKNEKNNKRKKLDLWPQSTPEDFVTSND